MKRNHLIYKSVLFYKRFYKLIATATLITVTVITGSLVIGDSIRTTLIKRVAERLGDTETIVFSRNSFMEDRILESAALKDSTRGVLLTNGFVSQSGKLIPVFVWGVDDLSIATGTTRINQALFHELETRQPEAIVLRLPATGLVPSGSLFVTENYTTGMRLDFAGIVDVQDGGNISLKNEQTIPLNIFVNRRELSTAMQLEGKINLLLTNKKITATGFEQIWDYSASGLSVSQMNDFTEITSDRIFLQKEVVASIGRNNHEANLLFSYLANAIERLADSNAGTQEDASIPYSFVTAMERYKEEVISPDEIILSDYTANRLRAKPGDSIKVSYYTSKDLKVLQTRAVTLRVKKIVPLSELANDTTLSAEFPGLSDVESCTDWDSDLPINMDLITNEDESYWDLYRTTPKALISYQAIADDWSNEYGSATAVRLNHPKDSTDIRSANRMPDLSELHAGMFGIQLIHPREAGLTAAKNGVDFSGLFLALGFFIIISAILLTIVPLLEMIFQRSSEIATLKAIGYPQKRIIRLLWAESAPVVLVASIIGVLAGIVYTSLIIWLLGSYWKGATHTDGFSVYPDMTMMLTGTLVGIILTFIILLQTIKRNLKEVKVGVTTKKISVGRRRTHAVFSFVIACSLLIANHFFLHSVALFVVSGITLLATAAIWGDYVICRNCAAFSGVFNDKKMIWSTLYANKKQVMLSFLTLSIGVFVVFSVGLNRKGFDNSSQLRTGTAGYSLWCESSVPVYHNMTIREGREKLSLTTLPADTEILQCLRLSADDASCLNLNKVTTPTVLGVDMYMLAQSELNIKKNIYSLGSADAFKQLQTRTESAYPALVDETVLTWSLGLNLGDTLFYADDSGQSVAILLAGTLPNTIFQGNILIDKHFFSDIWKETTGSEVFLLKIDESEKETVKTLLTQALNEYGIRVTTTNERLKQFNTVTDTYLTIFMSLGGIGLLLGIMSFVIVVRKSLAARCKEIDLYKTLGFPNEKITQMLSKENLITPLYAIMTGALCAIAGVGVSFTNTGTWIWFMALLFTIAFIACVTFFVQKSVISAIEMRVHESLISIDPAIYPTAGK